jgi:hypothetical protein
MRRVTRRSGAVLVAFLVLGFGAAACGGSSKSSPGGGSGATNTGMTGGTSTGTTTKSGGSGY